MGKKVDLAPMSLAARKAKRQKGPKKGVEVEEEGVDDVDDGQEEEGGQEEDDEEEDDDDDDEKEEDKEEAVCEGKGDGEGGEGAEKAGPAANEKAKKRRMVVDKESH